MKALVIGAAGHIGNAITRALLERKWEVTACGRRPIPPLNLNGLPVTYLAGDAESPHQLEEWIAGHDLVVDGAAPYPLSLVFAGREPEQDPFLAAERRTRRLLNAVLRHEARLAYVSSFVTQVSPRTQAQRFRARTIRLTLPYFEVKELIESQILDDARRGIRAIIINPTYCLGPWDLHDRRFCTIPLLLCGEIPGCITQTLNVIDVRDVAAGLVAAIEAERYGEPLLMTGCSVSTHDLYSSICEIGGVTAPKFVTSSTFAMFWSYWTEIMFDMLGQQTPIISAGMMMATVTDYLHNNTIMEELGIRSRPLSDTIRDAIKWYRAIGYC
jgi:dihydroflavonol-4-reductase